MSIKKLLHTPRFEGESFLHAYWHWVLVVPMAGCLYGVVHYSIEFIKLF